MLRAKQAWYLLASWLVSFVLCLGDQSICFTDFDNRHPSMGVNLRGPQMLKHGVSISYQPDLFLTDRYSQDFHSLFGHHIKTFLQSLSIMCWLVDFIVTSSMVSEPNNFLSAN